MDRVGEAEEVPLVLLAHVEEHIALAAMLSLDERVWRDLVG
jgi:hypothetical protein